MMVNISTQHHHRSALKQNNKPFKGKSKGKQDRKNNGRIAIIKNTVNNKSLNKQQRIQRNKNVQLQKRQQIIQNKRIGTKHGVPKYISLFGLNSNINTDDIVQYIKNNITQQQHNNHHGMYIV